MIIHLPRQELPRIIWLAQAYGPDASGRYIRRITENLQREQSAEVILFPQRPDLAPQPAA